MTDTVISAKEGNVSTCINARHDCIHSADQGWGGCGGGEEVD